MNGTLGGIIAGAAMAFTLCGLTIRESITNSARDYNARVDNISPRRITYVLGGAIALGAAIGGTMGYGAQRLERREQRVE